MATSLRHNEIIRGKILQYLALIYPQAATFPLLQGELDIFGYPVTADQLEFHLAYLAEKELVAVKQIRGPLSRHRVSLVRITAHGIDYYDGRVPPDEGIYLGPKA